MFDPIGIIGAGRITGILLNGWQRRTTSLPRIAVCDIDGAASHRLQQEHPTIHLAKLEDTVDCELLLLAVHPPVLRELLPRLSSLIHKKTLVCSLSPQVRLPQLRAGLAGHEAVARMNPNAPAIIGAGFNPVAFAEGVTPSQKASLRTLFAPLGQMPTVPDHQLETYAVISAMGPTYFWFQFQTMVTTAESFGLTHAEASTAVSSMLHGAVDTLLASGMTPTQVMDLVPIRPMEDEEGSISELLANKLATIHGRLHAAQ